MSSARDKWAKAEGAILVTRPEPGATDLARQLAERSRLSVFKAPLAKTEPAPFTPPDPTRFDALLITSPRAVEAAAHYANLPVYAVGGASAKAARAAGLTVLAEGPGRIGDQLAALIPPGTRLLHFCGETVATDPAPLLEPRGVNYRRVVTYRSAPVASPPEDLRRFFAAPGPHYVTFLSARVAETFTSLTLAEASAGALPPLTALCLSPRVEEAAKTTGRFAKTCSQGQPEPERFVDFALSRCT
ncbi:uroporphyrinogen-III synthase [Parvularcula lutaonensis]|uniref:Uroporphyrinogen-III synthase n=1 Tax=Parvularcula lutaonensis TaxID=491923 RepID=A0ABV7MAD9_9PROT|nr:uroporphyrinogen-III synthase [Parvularcula lutaonensis]GGY37361.1 uroporphyrinogen III methyltransferase [Parvularcula lutaonensis]